MDSVNPFNHLKSDSFPDSWVFAAIFLPISSSSTTHTLLLINLHSLPIAHPNLWVSVNNNFYNGLESIIANMHNSFLESIQIVWEIFLQWYSQRWKAGLWCFPHINPGKGFERQLAQLCLDILCFPSPPQYVLSFPLLPPKYCQHLTNYIFYSFSLFVAF